MKMFSEPVGFENCKRYILFRGLFITDQYGIVKMIYKYFRV